MFLACYTLVTYPFRKHLWMFPGFLGIGAQKNLERPGSTRTWRLIRRSVCRRSRSFITSATSRIRFPLGSCAE